MLRAKTFVIKFDLADAKIEAEEVELEISKITEEDIHFKEKIET